MEKKFGDVKTKEYVYKVYKSNVDYIIKKKLVKDIILFNFIVDKYGYKVGLEFDDGEIIFLYRKNTIVKIGQNATSAIYLCSNLDAAKNLVKKLIEEEIEKLQIKITSFNIKLNNNKNKLKKGIFNIK